ncbi:MAG: single-stranded-DNA-specific exonuclease RecJ [Aggregatilineales bacterium]
MAVREAAHLAIGNASSALPVRRWRVAPPLSDADYAPFRGMNRVLASILYRRGVLDHLSATRFLKGEIALADPFQMRGIPEAVGRIRRAIKTGELVVVYGDFDADGVTSTALLVTALRAIGANTRFYIPNRVDEGYGLNCEALAKLKRGGAKLAITVDCGIRSLAEVEYGVHECGLDMIVTDHHSVGPDVPDCIVVNPKQPGCRYGEDMLAGVGVTYRLAEALFRVTAANSRDRQPPFPIDHLLDLAAIGTIADLVPLDHPENRALAMWGLDRIRREPRPGLKALLDVATTESAAVDAQTIGFRIAPRINAAGRLASAEVAYRLLMASTYDEARPFADQLQRLNIERQELTRQSQEYAMQLIGDPRSVPLIFADSPDFPTGIVGLVAGRLTEEFARPSVIVQRGPEECHGSCRSPESFHITAALDDCAELLTRHGGHAQAAGFALPTANLAAFRERLMTIAASRLQEADLVPVLSIDAEVGLGDISVDLIDELARLEPTGHGHPSPVLAVRRARVLERRVIGANSDHLKLRLADGEYEIEAVAWRMGKYIDAIPGRVNVAFHPEMNEWQGQKRLQLNVQDIQAAE